MSTVDTVVAALWEERVRWSRAADAWKRRNDRARATAFALGVAGAVAETFAATVLASQGPAKAAVAAFGAVCLALATFVANRFLTADATRNWTRARAVSETVKHQVYSFRARPAAEQTHGAALRLAAETTSVTEHVADLAALACEFDGSGDAPPGQLPPAQYVEVRVEGQARDYYSARARQYARRSRRLRWAALALGVATTALATSAAALAGGAEAGSTSFGHGLAAWVAVLTTVGGGLAAHIAARRYDSQALTFTVAALRLRQLAARWRAEGSPVAEPAWSAFVEACESVIRDENASWTAGWAEVATAK